MNASSKCPSVEQLQLLIAGKLSDPPTQDLESHLLNCDACAEQTAQFQLDDTLVAALKGAGPLAIEQSSEEQVRLDRLMTVLSALHVQQVDQTVLATTPLPIGNEHAIQSVTNELSAVWQPPQRPDELGRLGGYRILKFLGSGGMGGVFLAEDLQLRRRVALKLMRPRAASAPEAAERFLREARAGAALRHDQIITIYQVGEDAGVPFLAMEYLEGESLEDRLRRESPLPIRDVLHVCSQIADGLAAAHAKGLIHRDIKPANVWLESRPLAGQMEHHGDPDADGVTTRVEAHESVPALGPVTDKPGNPIRVKLLDFGLARSSEAESQLTSSGIILGTPAYMAPEQANSDEVDARADLFSLGVVLYRMTTGMLPFPGTRTMEILKSLITITPASPMALNPSVPLELSKLIDQLLSKDRDQRPATAREVSERVARIATQSPRSTPFGGHTDATSAPDFRRGLLVTHSEKPRPWSRGLAVATLFAASAMFALIVITLRSRDGKETKVTIDVPEGTNLVSVEQKPNHKAIEKTGDKADDEIRSAQHTTTKDANSSNPKEPQFSTLDALNAERIPESERADWQPEDLVAVIGTQQLRSWRTITDVEFHPSSAFFIGASGYGELQVWSTNTLKRLGGTGDANFPLTRSEADSPCFSPDGKSLFTGTGRYAVEISAANLPTFKLVAQRPRHQVRGWERMVVSPDSRWLIMGGVPAGILELWDVSDDHFQFVKEFHFESPEVGGFLGQTHFMSLSGDGHRLAHYVSGSGEGSSSTVLMWDIDWAAADGPELKVFSEPIPAKRAALSADGQKLVATGEKYQVYELSTPPHVEAEFDGAISAKFSPDGNSIAYVYPSGIVVCRRSGREWIERLRLPAVTGNNCAFWFSPDGRWLVVSEYEPGWLRVWDLAASVPVERAPSTPYSSATFSPDGHMLATGGTRGLASSAVWTLDTDMPQLLRTMPAFGGQASSFSADSQLVAFSHVDGYTTIWNLDRRTIPSHSTEMQGFAHFVPHGQTLEMMRGSDRKVISQTWELTKQGKFRLSNETTEIASLVEGLQVSCVVAALRSLRPETGRFVNLQKSGKLQVLDLSDPVKVLFELQYPGTNVKSFDLSANGKLLAAHGYADKCVVWDLTETPPREYLLPDYFVSNDVRFVNQGHELVIATDHGIEIHDWAAKRLVRRINFAGPVTSLSLHPDGRHLATANGNGTIYILRIPELTGRN